MPDQDRLSQNHAGQRQPHHDSDTPVHASADSCLDALFARTGPHVVIGTPLGIGKPHRLLNAINESIHGATDADSLFHTLCGVAVKAGGFRMAWIGRVDSDGPDGGTRIMPVTSAGVDDGYTDSIQREPDRFVQSRLVAVQALGSGSLAVIDDLAAEPADDWVQAGLERGYRAAAGIPVRQAGTIVAVMVIMSEEPNRFGGPERELLVSLGRSVSRALDFAHAEAQRLLAQKAVLQGTWLSWVASQIYLLRPAAYASMVRRELARLQETTEN